VPLTGIRKAALLLKNLEPTTAAELLKATPPEVVKRIAAELVVLDADEPSDDDAVQAAIEFLRLLHTGGSEDLQTFVRSVLAEALGEEKCDEILGEVHRLVDHRDPFLPIRQADVPTLAEALRGLHPQAVAMVLMELDPEKSAALIPMLEDSVRAETVRRMTLGQRVSVEAQMRVAAMIRDRLRVAQEQKTTGRPTAAPDQADARLRRIALLMRRLRRNLRDSLLDAIRQRDPDQARRIQDLMVTWEDLPALADRSLQDILRTMDAGQLALALQGADPKTTRKIRANISERAAAMVDEEVSLLGKPKPEEIEAAREKILNELRALNAAGELAFEEPADAAVR